MTTLDHRPAPAKTIDGEVLTTGPTTNPHRFDLWASATVLLGATAGALTQFDGSGDIPEFSVVALLAAFFLFLTCLFRFGDRARAGDR